MCNVGFNLPSLVLKARHLGGSTFCNFCGLKVSEQALGGIPLGFGIVVEDKPSELSCVQSLVRRIINCSI